MKLFNHFAAVGYSNTYLIGGDNGGDAILIDPGRMDVPLLQIIEDNNYQIKHILITHGHIKHFGGIKTLLKIYDAKIYGAQKELKGLSCTPLVAGIYHLSNFEVEVIPISGHSFDSLIFKIGHLYFTGDTLSAGCLGSTPDAYTRIQLLENINKKLFSQDEHGILLPGHGPPSTIKVERDNLYHLLKDKKII